GQINHHIFRLRRISMPCLCPDPVYDEQITRSLRLSAAESQGDMRVFKAKKIIVRVHHAITGRCLDRRQLFGACDKGCVLDSISIKIPNHYRGGEVRSQHESFSELAMDEIIHLLHFLRAEFRSSGCFGWRIFWSLLRQEKG